MKAQATALVVALAVAALVLVAALRVAAPKERIGWLGKASVSGSKAAKVSLGAASASASLGTGAKTAGAAQASRGSASTVQRAQAAADAARDANARAQAGKAAIARAAAAAKGKVPKPPPRKRKPIQRAKARAVQGAAAGAKVVASGAKAVATGAKAVATGSRALAKEAVRMVGVAGRATGRAATDAALAVVRTVDKFRPRQRVPPALSLPSSTGDVPIGATWRDGDPVWFGSNSDVSSDFSRTTVATDEFSPFGKNYDHAPYVDVPLKNISRVDARDVVRRLETMDHRAVPGNNDALGHYRKVVILEAWNQVPPLLPSGRSSTDRVRALAWAYLLTTNREALNQEARIVYNTLRARALEAQQAA